MSEEKDYKQLWKIALAQMEVKLDNPVHFRTWFMPTNLIEIKGKKATVAVRNHYGADWLKRKHQDMLESTLSYVYGEKVKVNYKISEELTEEPATKTIKTTQKSPSLLDINEGESNDLHQQLVKAKLNPKLSFENFVAGESNSMAHAAAQAVADNPGEVYNPLFIHGHTGLGKTHLAHSVGRRVLERNSNSKVIYISAEGFMNEMVKAIKSGKNIKFREKYRKSADILIIDDIQFISTWEKTQTEFFNTFNVLQAANKQVIIISDRPPEDLEKLTPRLRSRFQGGMVVDVARPEYEHRLAILERKLTQMGKKLHARYLEFIAKNITDNIRELEGALQKIVLINGLQPEHELTMEEVAKQLGKDTLTKRKKITVPSVIKTVAKEFDLKVSDIKSRRRTAEVALARQVCMYILRQELNYKLEEIAKFLNRKDHTTIMHGVDKIASKRLADEAFRNQMVRLVDKVSGYED
jgi:chromosomal replication initiator protein